MHKERKRRGILIPVRNQGGLTLIELMVASAVGMILVLGAVTVYTQSRTNFQMSDSVARLQENARFALGLLAGLVMARFTPQIDKAKEQTARTQMEILGLALDNYRLDVGTYPDSLEGLIDSSAEGWRGPYLKKNKIPVDPWDEPYTYEVVDNGDDYRISSTGGGKGSINSWE